MPHRNNVVPKRAVHKEDVSAALSEAWFRTARSIGGKGTLADRVGSTTKTVDNAIAGKTLPELHTALNSLLACPTALDEVFRLYGGRFVPFTSQAANDFSTIAALNHGIGEWVNALSDMRRDHNETVQLADLFRPLVTQLSALIQEADEIRRGRAA